MLPCAGADAATVPVGPRATAAHAMVPNLEKQEEEMSILAAARVVWRLLCEREGPHTPKAGRYPGVSPALSH